jgi:hypothetical protein
MFADHYQYLISCSPFLNSSLLVHFLTGGFLLKCFSVIFSIPMCHLLYRMSSLCFFGWEHRAENSQEAHPEGGCKAHVQYL